MIVKKVRLDVEMEAVENLSCFVLLLEIHAQLILATGALMECVLKMKIHARLLMVVLLHSLHCAQMDSVLPLQSSVITQ